MKTILIVDDLERNLYLLRSILADAGYQIFEARNGSEALGVARQEPPDVIISDVLMPVMDGFSFCRACKQDKQLAAIPFVFYTATYTDPQDEALAFKLGAARFLVRPVETGEFLAMLRQVLREFEQGQLGFSDVPPEDETTYFRLYNEVLINRLEHKVVELEQQIRQREEVEALAHLQLAALSATANAIVITDTEGIIEWVNPAFSTLTGYSLAESVGHNPRDLIRSGRHSRTFYSQMWQTILAGSVWQGEIINRRKDGSFYTEEQTITPVPDKTGRITHFVSVKQDVTARKETEARLLQTQQRLQQAASAGNVGLWDWDLRTNKVYFSPEWKRQVGYADGEISNNFDEWQSRVHPDDLPRCLKTVNDFIANPWPGYQLEFRFRHKDGSYRIILARASLLYDEAGQAVRMLGSHLDITTLRELEVEKEALAAQVYQAQKVESIGRLASGIAHDFNNMLVPIIGFAELGLIDSPPDSKAANHFSQIKVAGERAKDLTRQLLAFSRHQVLELTAVNLNKLVSDLEKILQRLVRENVEFRLRLAADIGLVTADVGQIEQVLMNLVINASDAMPTGGTLTIETANVTLDETYVAAHLGSRPGPYVMLTVTDTGHGMDSATRERIFEPFFSTKERGKGTGLGLSTVFGIVKQHGGNIWVYSEPDMGATFKVYLPVTDKPVSNHTPSEQSIAEMPTGTETVLLVEDDDSVREVVNNVLQMYGYRVLAAEDRDRAMALVEAHDGPIDLLLTDVILPKVTGLELYRQLGQIRPKLKVLYMSGYTDDAISQLQTLEKGVAFLQKPFSIRVLLKKIRAALG
ncbi:MAG: hypothetical protein Kow0031_12630 [Anaerolineae bacterium]